MDRDGLAPEVRLVVPHVAHHAASVDRVLAESHAFAHQPVVEILAFLGTVHCVALGDERGRSRHGSEEVPDDAHALVCGGVLFWHHGRRIRDAVEFQELVAHQLQHVPVRANAPGDGVGRAVQPGVTVFCARVRAAVPDGVFGDEIVDGVVSDGGIFHDRLLW